jgi:outer membrane protein W
VFSYRNEYRWHDNEIPDNTLDLNYYLEQYLDYIDIPLTIKIEYPTNTFRPYVEFGAYYGWLVYANKQVAVSGIDRASGSNRYFERESLSVGASELYANFSAGLIGGIGVNYDAGNIRLSLDVKYRYGLNNIADEKNRYRDARLAGIGDVTDDFRMNNIEMNFGILFPMRFLSRDFTATE